MIIYIDTSALLSIIFEEDGHKTAMEIWSESDLRFSSVLLKAESKISLRRIYKNYQKKLGKDWISEKEIKLNSLLEEINFCNLDEAIIEMIDSKPLFSECRSLDAIHLATAMEIQSNIREKIEIFSFDKEFISLGLKLGFKDAFQKKRLNN